MTEQHEVVLDVATEADAELLSNLLELYVHDLSAVFPSVELGADGRFGYGKLALHWTEPELRYAFVIRCDGRVAGFALITRGSPASEDPRVFDVAEFFVLRRYRRTSVGRRAAVLLWRRLPGTWIVRVSEANRDALEFWAPVIAEFAGGDAVVSSRPGESHSWRVYSFDSARIRSSAHRNGLE